MTSRVSPNQPRVPVARTTGTAPTTTTPSKPVSTGGRLLANSFGGATRAAEPLSGADAVSAQAKLDAIGRLANGHTDRAEEGKILDLFRAASPKELNYLVARLDMHELLEDIDDRLIGPDNRTALVTILTKDRVKDLSLGARVSLINAFQSGGTGGLEETGIRNLFVATKGKDLTALKNGVDAGNDWHDLQQLVFHDIDDPKLRAEILTHFQKEAVPTGESKVLSDIDDTFYENLKDTRFPKKTVYPGVISFYAELDKGAAAQAGRSGDLAFVTARPNDRAGLVESLTEKTLQSHGVKDAVVLQGDLLSNLSNDAIAKKKFENFTQYKQLFPEYSFVFTGDSGQGDVIFGAKMREAAPKDVKAVFINDVVNTPQAKRDEYRRKGVFFTDTYVGAAVEAFKLGLMSKEGLQRVAQAAKEDFAKIPFTDENQKKARAGELQRDVAAAEAAIR
ncbi:MAG: hypothetical protein Q8L14_13140 [Myxococcales bacterium]|nr:hypothetical protein [Myxococcales bacterium]